MSTESLPDGKHCSRCDGWKPLEDFYRHKNGKYGRQAQCKSCISYQSQNGFDTRLTYVVPESKPCLKCGERKLLSEFYRESRMRDGRHSWCKYCFSAYQESRYGKRRRQRLRVEVLLAYSPDGPHCACCGEAEYEFLCIDHIHGGGGKHRREVGGGAQAYYWLKNNGYPDGFRVLCHNCNFSRGMYGYCPHERNVQNE